MCVSFWAGIMVGIVLGSVGWDLLQESWESWARLGKELRDYGEAEEVIFIHDNGASAVNP